MSSDSASAPGYGLRTQPLRKRIAQLETKVQAVRKQAQRQRIAHKCGHEFLALVDSDRKIAVAMWF